MSLCLYVFLMFSFWLFFFFVCFVLVSLFLFDLILSSSYYYCMPFFQMRERGGEMVKIWVEQEMGKMWEELGTH